MTKTNLFPSSLYLQSKIYGNEISFTFLPLICSGFLLGDDNNSSDSLLIFEIELISVD